MQVKNLIIALMTIIILLPFAGCYQSEPVTGPYAPPAYTSFAAKESPSAEIQSPTAVESAIALSDKYAKLSEETSALKQRKQALDAENKKLTEDLQNCRGQMERAQKELAEVNDLLVQMRLELNNWKSDVLGFRDEMRDAEKAQLEALLKILKLLGGEIKTDTTQPSQQDLPGNPEKSDQTQPSSEEQK
jgi:chromosome segregation ATPase